MHDESVDDALKELEAALEDVRPSPEFGVRVGMAIARDEERRVVFGRFPWLIGGISAAAAILVATFWIGHRPPVARVDDGLVAKAVTPAQPALPDTPGSAIGVRRSSPRPSPPQAALVDDSGVLVPADQLAALRQYLRAAGSGRANIPSELISADVPLPKLAPIEIPAIDIQPLPAPSPALSGEAGERRDQ